MYTLRVAELHEYKEKPGSCAACGNSPVNHTGTWILNTLNVLFSKLSYAARETKLLRRLEYLARVLMEWLDGWHTRSLARLGVIRFGMDLAKARTYRSQVVWEEAQRRGIEMQQVILGGAYTDVYRAMLRGRWHYFKSLPIPDELPQAAYLWIDDKFSLKRGLAAAGIPAPATRSVVTESYAVLAFRELGAPVVVKPRAGSRGRHTTTAISTEEDLRRAFKIARKLCFFVSVERYLEGPVCRATLVGGKLVGFFAATPPQVIGDGHSTIRELIALRNAALPERVQSITITAEHEAQLAREGLSLDAVPADGRIVPLTHRTGRLFGGETRELLDTVHPKLRETLERAARVFNVPVVGFDVIIKDPEADPDTQPWGIIEANSLPFIDLHYLPLYGKPSNPAADVWNLWA
jgi:hypothetical protein